jgi:uncharacterized phiE125 gp8 family phage protein
MRVVVIEAPRPVIDLADALQHLRVDNGVDDALVMGMVAAATGHVEDCTERAIGARMLEARYDAFETARCARLPVVPAAEIVSFRWRGADGQWHGGDLADVELDGRDVVPISAAPWSGLSLAPGSLRIVYRAGYPDDETGGEPRSTVPEQIRAAILLMTSFLYHNRGSQTAEPPAAVAILLQPFRVFA